MLPTEELDRGCLLCRHVPWVTCGYFSCFFSLVTAFEGSSPQVRGQLVLLWMVPWAGLEGEGREAPACGRGRSLSGSGCSGGSSGSGDRGLGAKPPASHPGSASYWLDELGHMT